MFAHYKKPGEISCSMSAMSSWVFLVLIWLVSLAELSFWLLQIPCFLPRFFEACLLASCLKLAAASNVGRAINHGYTSGYTQAASVSLIHPGDYCAAKPPTLDPTINTD